MSCHRAVLSVGVILWMMAVSPLGAVGDGWQWVHPLPQGLSLSSAAVGDGRWVAVGESGAVAVSRDGRAWQAVSSGLGAHLYGVARFVAVGGGGLIAVSADGGTWEPRPSGSEHDVKEVVWSGDRFVAVGSRGFIAVSFDGLDWTTAATGVTSTIQDVA